MRFVEMISVTVVFALGAQVQSDVIEFEEKSEWEGAVGDYTTIDFTGFVEGTFITDQYENLGALFTQGDDWIRLSDSLFLNDGAGLNGNATGVHVQFNQPTSSIAAEFPGGLKFELFRDGQSIYLSDTFGGDPGEFGGLVSTDPFDAAFIFDPTGGLVTFDDLHFGPPIPVPAVGVILLAGLAAPRRRRRSGFA